MSLYVFFVLGVEHENGKAAYQITTRYRGPTYDLKCFTPTISGTHYKLNVGHLLYIVIDTPKSLKRVKTASI